MQAANIGWEHLRFALAVHRGGSFAAAARKLEVELSTVGRRVHALEQQAGAKLFVRTPAGLAATRPGRAVVEAAARMEAEIAGLARALASESGARRSVRVAMTEAGAERLVALGAKKLGDRAAPFEIEIVTSNEAADLVRGEADLAVRLVRPREHGLVAKRIGTLKYALYGASAYVARAGRTIRLDDLSGHRVVLGAGALARSEEGRWMERASTGATVALRASSLLTVRAAVASGVGLAVLPTTLGDTTPGLSCIAIVEEAPKRPIYVVTHRQLQKDPRVRAVAAIIEEVLGTAERGTASAL